jgi:hypothetical protein
VTQKNSRPNHPTTCGKVERFQQTMKKWLRAQPDQPATIAELQSLIDAFVVEYNHHRPHRSLPHQGTPATAYTSRPKATPMQGTLYSIGIVRTHARTHVEVLVQDLDIRIIDASTGELLRELALDPNKRYQGTGRPPGPTR